MRSRGGSPGSRRARGSSSSATGRGIAATLATGAIPALPAMRAPKTIARFLSLVVPCSTMPAFVSHRTRAPTLATAMLGIVVPAIYPYVGPMTALPPTGFRASYHYSTSVRSVARDDPRVRGLAAAG